MFITNSGDDTIKNVIFDINLTKHEITMKIFAVCQFYYPENFTITPLLNELVRRGHEVTVLTGRPNAGFGRILEGYHRLRFEIIDGVKVHRVPIRPRKNGRISLILNFFSFFFLARMFALRHRGEYDVVLTMSLSPVISMVPAIDFAKRNKLPLLEYCVDLWPASVAFTNYVDHESLMYRLLKRWSGRIYRAADRLLVGSPSYAAYMEQVHRIPSAKIATLVQPALTDRLMTAPIVYEKGHNLVYVGNIGQVQLLDELVSALTDFIDVDLHVHIIGSGSSLPELKDKALRLHVDHMLTWYGTLPSETAFAYLPNADGLFLPLKEGGYVGKTIPNKMMMYLASGRPILAALCGDGRDILEQAGGGIIVTPDHHGIVGGLKKLLSLTEEEKNALGGRNRAYYEANHTLNKIGTDLETYLKDLVN